MHPGGPNILNNFEPEEDITASFNSYHSLSNRNYINNTLEKNRISDSFQYDEFSFDDNGFYINLKHEVYETYKGKNMKYAALTLHTAYSIQHDV
jgi:hypothetical protein